METLTLTEKSAEKLRTTQRAMERAMLGIRSGVQDIIENITMSKWNWAGHLARTKDGRWTKRIVEWRPRDTTRSRGRPPTRWTDDLKRIEGNWIQKA